MKVLKKLLEQRDKAAKELRKLDAGLKLDKPEKQEDGTERTEREPTPDEEQRMVKLLDSIEEFDKDIDREAKREKRDKKLADAREFVTRANEPPEVSVVSEPTMYGMNSDKEHSYFIDLIRYCTGPLVGNLDFGVVERMATHAHQIEREVAHDSKAGRDAMVQLRGMHMIRATANPMEAQSRLNEIRDRGRASLEAKQAEFRARATGQAASGAVEQRAGITTGGGATASSAGGGGAAFVIPVFYEDQYAPYREAGRPFADACNQRPLPPYGMTVYLPAVQSAAAVAAQSPEGGGITEQDPSAGFIAGGLVTTAGQITVTQQLLDRAGPNVQYDQIMFDQLRRDYAPKWDKYMITQALAGAGAISFGTGWTFAAQPGTPSFVSKTAGAVNAIETTNGTVMSPTDIFVQTSRWNFMESVGALESTSGTLHPLLVPQGNGPFNAYISGNQTGFVPYEGNTGYKLFGLPISKDLSIPTPASGADQAIVGNLDEVWAFEGPLVPRVVPQTLAPNLAVLLQLYSYGTGIVRYPLAVQAISGVGMATIAF